MASHTFGAYFDILPSSSKSAPIADPPAVFHKPSSSQPVSPIAPDAIELDSYRWGSRYNGPDSPAPIAADRTPNELEMSRPPSPKADDAVSPVQSFSNPPINRFRVLSACVIYFANGMQDSAPGALIPYMEKDYNIGYAIVSLIFVANALGFIVAAFFNDLLLHKLGRARTLMLSETISLMAAVMIACTPPYPVVVVAFFFLGFGAAINLAMNNVFCANLANPTVILGGAHGSYGIGGTVAPIAATALASSGILWSRFYLILLGLRVLNIGFAGWAFSHFERDASPELLTQVERTASRREAGEPTKRQLLKKALRSPVTILGALFIFAYQGAEVAISGWMISFLINYRNGNPAQVGYVTAGFWGGITIGRFVLTHVAHRIGEKPFVYGLTVGSICLQVLTWFVPNVISNAVSVSLIGLLLGPIYPCAQTIFARSLPRNIQMMSISFISSAGSSGGAVAPFTTGLLAQAVGTYVLHPVCIGMFVAMIGCWFGMPKIPKRRE